MGILKDKRTLTSLNKYTWYPERAVDDGTVIWPSFQKSPWLPNIVKSGFPRLLPLWNKINFFKGKIYFYIKNNRLKLLTSLSFNFIYYLKKSRFRNKTCFRNSFASCCLKSTLNDLSNINKLWKGDVFYLLIRLSLVYWQNKIHYLNWNKICLNRIWKALYPFVRFPILP